jgi:guanyl-specific ribonuclease Sa
MHGVVRFFKGASDNLMQTVAAIVQSLTPGVTLSKETQQAISDTLDYINKGTQPSWANKRWGEVWKNLGEPLPTGFTYTEYSVEPPAGVNSPGVMRILKGVDGNGNITWWYTPDHYVTFIQFVVK